MSKFLGKIHYWLFNKICWFEGLEGEIVSVMAGEGINTEEIINNIYNKYGAPLPNVPLEQQIDQNNIHGWLQEKIWMSEGRMAALTKAFMDCDKEALKKLASIYESQGMKAAEEVKNNGGAYGAPEQLFGRVNDYILDGMPCDRVNEIIGNDENAVTWIRTQCVHSAVWEKENCSADTFYSLRDIWIKTFIEGLNPDFEYVHFENGKMTIRRRGDN